MTVVCVGKGRGSSVGKGGVGAFKSDVITEKRGFIKSFRAAPHMALLEFRSETIR